jgi:hypothetical protein
MAIAQEAGYTLHIDFHTKEVNRAALVKVGELTRLPIFGTLDVCGLVALETNLSLGVGIGKSWKLGDQLRLNLGASYYDPGGAWQPHIGGYIGFSWNLNL